MSEIVHLPQNVVDAIRNTTSKYGDKEKAGRGPGSSVLASRFMDPIARQQQKIDKIAAK